MNINVINNTKFNINKKYYKNFLIDTTFISKINGTVTLVFVDNNEIKRLNKEYRNKNKITDVLTFVLDDNPHLSDIIISYEWVLNNIIEAKVKLEVCKLIIHSALHIKNIHHTYSKKSILKNRKKMKKLYDKVVSYRKQKKIRSSKA